MPSSKGSSNSNKTAHVMNLLRKNSPAPASRTAPAAPENPDTPVVQAQEPVQAPAAAQPAPAPQAAPIITALNADSEISSQIRDALAEELAQEAENQASALPVSPEEEEPVLVAEAPVSRTPEIPREIESQEKPSQEPETELQTEPPQEPEASTVSEEEENKSAVPVSAPSVPVIDPVVIPQEPEPIKSEDSDSSEGMLEPKLVNVMHQIVEDKADKYIRLFDVCPCPRCRKDVIALTLNQLPPKYVVMNKAELLLKSDMYEVRYNCEIVAQLMSACQIVKENPRH